MGRSSDDEERVGFFDVFFGASNDGVGAIGHNSHDEGGQQQPVPVNQALRDEQAQKQHGCRL